MRLAELHPVVSAQLVQRALPLWLATERGWQLRDDVMAPWPPVLGTDVFARGVEGKPGCEDHSVVCGLQLTGRQGRVAFARPGHGLLHVRRLGTMVRMMQTSPG